MNTQQEPTLELFYAIKINNISVKTVIGYYFYPPVDKHFPKGSAFHNIFNQIT